MITVDDVKDIIKTTMGDVLINKFIDAVNEKIGTCLSDNYSDDIADMIMVNMVAYTISVATGQQEKSSIRSPNGSSVSFNVGSAEKGIAQNPYGKIVQMFDTKGCYRAMVAKRVYIGGVGSDAGIKKGNCRGSLR